MHISAMREDFSTAKEPVYVDVVTYVIKLYNSEIAISSPPCEKVPLLQQLL
jgi:hypothetical protein